MLVFTPVQQTLTINMTKLASPNVGARCVDPDTGRFATVDWFSIREHWQPFIFRARRA